METTITATELAKNLSDILNRARYRGERFIIQRNGEVVAIKPPDAVRPVSLKVIASGLAKIPGPDDQFADDLEAAVNEMRQPTPEPPEWPNC